MTQVFTDKCTGYRITLVGLLVLFSGMITGLEAQLIINEVCSFNTSISDSFGETPDWIEVKNDSENAINLSQYYLSDDVNEIYKWQLPLVILLPGENQLIFSEENYSDDFHFNFGVST